jgi:hypothetical protein
VTEELVQGCRSLPAHAPEHMAQPGEWLNAATARRKDNIRNTGRRLAALMTAEEGPVAMADAMYRLARSVAGLSMSSWLSFRNPARASHHNVRAGQFAVIWSSETLLRPELFPHSRPADGWKATLKDLYRVV